MKMRSIIIASNNWSTGEFRSGSAESMEYIELITLQ
jgi:hypothetical protein